MEAKLQKLQNLFKEFVEVTKNVQVLCDARKYSISTKTKESTFNGSSSDECQVSTWEHTFNGSLSNDSQVSILEHTFNGNISNESQVNIIEPTFNGILLDDSQVKTIKPTFNVIISNDSQVSTLEHNGNRSNESQVNTFEPTFNGIFLDESAVNDANDTLEGDKVEATTEPISEPSNVTVTSATRMNVVHDTVNGVVFETESPNFSKLAPIDNSTALDTTPWKIFIQPNRGCDDTSMFVPTSNGGPKKHCCAYCHKRYQKLVPHLLSVHKNEPDVKKFRDLPIGSRARRGIINKIRNKGQFEWNNDAKINGGELIPSRRPNKKFKKTGTDFETCAGNFVADNIIS